MTYKKGTFKREIKEIARKIYIIYQKSDADSKGLSDIFEDIGETVADEYGGDMET